MQITHYAFHAYGVTREIAGMVRCKRCKSVARVTGTLDRYRNGMDRFGNDRYESTVHWPEVNCCGSRWYVQRIHGEVTERKCDARCLNAIGPNCECACGGKNHGIGHAA